MLFSGEVPGVEIREGKNEVHIPMEPNYTNWHENDVDGDEYCWCACSKCDCDDDSGACGANCSPDLQETLAFGNCSDGYDNDCDEWIDEAAPGCYNMAYILAGCFDMGDHFNEGDSDELPVHNVCISTFAMDVHEVTNAEYAKCVDAGMCTAPPYTYSITRSTYYGDPAYDDFPVIYMNWHNAEDYCTWAGKRLPTEAEWEYAARGGLPEPPDMEYKRYPWGDTIDCDDANYGRGDSSSPCLDHCHNGECDNDTHPAENYAPNGYGLYDMAGNVREWTNDWYQADYYSVSPENNPQGPASGFYRVQRGGSWYSFNFFEYYPRVAARSMSNPSSKACFVGFRCAW
ncbi:formylglycine-generating enzyme family protein [Thermodesulfobacteriota bacterium]